MAETVGRLPSAVAVESAAGRTWTYAEMDEAAERLARALERRGAGPGSRVALLAHPSPDGVAAVHGILRSGAVLAPVHPRWTAAEREAFAAAARPIAVVAERTLLRSPEPEGGAEGEPDEVLRGLQEAEGLLVRSPAAERPPTGHATAERDVSRTLLWTSGTSGGARGVRLSLAAHRASADGARERLGLGPDDRWLVSLALAHVGGLALVLRAAWTGCRVVTLPGGFDSGAALELAADGRVTHASVVPVMLRRLLDGLRGSALPGALRCLLVGGAAAPPGLLDRALAARAPVALTYGLTEAASQVATAPPELVRRRPGTVGPPLPGVELGIGTDGEIRVRGPTLMEGYLVPGSGAGGRSTGAIGLDEEGWLRTGDSGRLDEEGHLWVTGRLSGRIVTGGLTVDPVEVERALERHPAVGEVAVVGLPDEEWGERVAAAVVAATAGGGSELAAELDAFARVALSGGRRPRVWTFLDALPRNPNGKVDRAEVRRRIEAGRGMEAGRGGRATGGRGAKESGGG